VLSVSVGLYIDIPEDWTLCKQPPDRWRVRERVDGGGSRRSDGLLTYFNSSELKNSMWQMLIAVSH